MSNTSDLGQRAKEHATELGTQAKAAATQEAVARADQVKDTAADTVQQVADAADAAAGQLDPASPQAHAVQQVADHIETVASKLRTADMHQLASQATDVARRNPLLFIGGAAIVGFAAARFLKARDPFPQPYYNAGANDPWGTHYAGSRSYPGVETTNTGVMNKVNGGRNDG